MALSNYTELQATVADYLNRDDLTSVIPDFIALAEAEFNRDIRHRRMVTQTSLVINAQYEDLPTDFLEAKALIVQDTTPYLCDFRTMASAADFNWQRDGAPGIPACYSVVGEQLQFTPTPDAAYTGTLTYYAKIPDLATNSTNWLLTNHPGIYLYGTLLQAAPYLHDDERLVTWGTLLTTALDKLVVEDQRAQFNASPLVMRPRRAFG